jgi:high-affinity nickel-transport protein
VAVGRFGDRLRLLRGALKGGDWARLGGFGAAVLGINALGWSMLIAGVLASGSRILLGLGITAWMFGLRHAFDADHISAIDNTTRKLLSDGGRPLGVGFFFSLGHSTIVFGLAAAVAVAAGMVSPQVRAGGALQGVGGLIGTAVSAGFLILIALINLVILRGLWGIARELRSGRYDEPTLERRLRDRGLLNRLLGPIARSIRASWQMYPIGVLFGLGFDTATEVALLALSANAAAEGIPWFATLSLPTLFAGGMSLMDTADGAFMNVAYGWAFSSPARKVFYNLAITALSVAVALLVGGVEVIQILAPAHPTGALWGILSSLDINTMGYVIVAMFVVTWGLAVTVWKVGRIESRWKPAVVRVEAPPLPIAARGAQPASHTHHPGEHEGAT